MVVDGAISRPDRAPMKAAMVNVWLPAASPEMPINRAPVRLTDVARSALPVRVRSKNRYMATSKATEAPKMISVWPVKLSGPTSKRASQNAGVR